MGDLSSRLDCLRLAVENLMKSGGTPGLTLSVVKSGVPVYRGNFGHRDAEDGLSVTDETVFPICSLTKAITAAAVGILVEEGKLAWDTLVKDALPTFRSSDEMLQNHLTVTDLLSHRSGMAWADNLVIGTENNILISGKDGMAHINSQPRLLPFRGQFSYNNLPFDLAGYLIEHLSGQSWSEFVQTRILDPLGLDRTFLKPPPPDAENVTTCYNALDDATAVPVPGPKAGSDGFAGPSGGMWSCARDLTRLYTTFSDSFGHQSASGATSTSSSPFKQVAALTSAKIAMDQPSRNELSYACGWARAQLPNRLGQIGLNPGLLPGGMPVVGKGTQSQLLLFHQGSLVGALCAVMMLPDTDTIIIVLSNALALNDVADWAAQLVLEEVLGVPVEQRVDFVKFAGEAVTENLKWYPAIAKSLNDAQQPGTLPRDLGEYVGTYWSDSRAFRVVVTLESGKLSWAFQGLQSEKFQLNHHENDSFTWLLPRNELSRRGRWVGSDQGPDFWKAEFQATPSGGGIESLLWAHDIDVPSLLLKKETSSSSSWWRTKRTWEWFWTW
jgi:CubicO group peptidase (beta-lactamase class C family)